MPRAKIQVCPECTETFINPGDREDHGIRRHNKPRKPCPHKALGCPWVGTNRDLARHKHVCEVMLKATGQSKRVWLCPFCKGTETGGSGSRKDNVKERHSKKCVHRHGAVLKAADFVHGIQDDIDAFRLNRTFCAICFPPAQANLGYQEANAAAAPIAPAPVEEPIRNYNCFHAGEKVIAPAPLQELQQPVPAAPAEIFPNPEQQAFDCFVRVAETTTTIPPAWRFDANTWTNAVQYSLLLAGLECGVAPAGNNLFGPSAWCADVLAAIERQAVYQAGIWEMSENVRYCFAFEVKRLFVIDQLNGMGYTFEV